MSPFPRHLVFALSVALAAAQAVLAQQNPPHIGYVYPAGGRQGDTFQVTIGGQYLDRDANAILSGSGVQATLVEHAKPLTPQQVKDLREKVQELRKIKPKNAEIIKQIAGIAAKLDEAQNRRTNPVLADRAIFQISIAPDAEPGPREFRLTTEMGLSNPLVFQVGQLTEFREKKLEGGEPILVKRPKEPKELRRAAPKPETEITLPATVNGQIMPGGVARFHFQARKGQRLVVAVSARELIPYLADAVPGWFQAAVAIYDPNGDELVYDDHYRFRPDPVLYCRIPKDGQYVLEIHDALYRGREDFVYRVAIGELPFVTGIFPLGGTAGTQTTVELKGWNLPSTKLTVDAKDRGEGLLPISIHKGKLISNRVPFAVDSLPECLEQEPNDQPANAQPVTLPVIINGRIGRPGDWDVFRLEGRAGERIVAEVDARKLDSPLDSVLKLTDAAGAQLAFNDDYADKGSGLSTHHADSLLTATLPANGVYYLHLGDVQHKGGAEYAYRLRISAPRPDFALRVTPSSVNVRAGAAVPITVYALRQDGFADEIVLSMKDIPKGFKLSGGRLPAKQDQVRLTLTAPQAPLEEPVPLVLEGRAKIEGREVVRQAVPAEDMMQAFIYRHLVPMKSFLAAVSGRERRRAPLKLLAEGPVKLVAGGTVPVRFSVPPGPLLDQMELTLSDPPTGISIEKVSHVQEGVTIVLHADAAKVKPGLKGNLIVDASVERTFPAKGGKPQNVKRRVSLGSMPAIPFEVVEKQP